MNNHYFHNNPNLDNKKHEIKFTLNGKHYRFLTSSGVFSKSHIDFGTKTLIDAISVKSGNEKLLDLGCGYGVIGITLKGQYPNLDVTQVDINSRAVELTKENSELNQINTKAFVSDGFSELTGKMFDVIVLNPPIRSGKQNVFNLYKSAYEHLVSGGEFWIVIQKKQGAPSHHKFLQELFSEVEIVKRNKGYYIFKSKKGL